MAGRAALQTDWDSLTVGIVNFDLGSRNGRSARAAFARRWRETRV